MVETRNQTLEEVDYAFRSLVTRQQWEGRVIQAQELEVGEKEASTTRTKEEQL